MSSVLMSEMSLYSSHTTVFIFYKVALHVVFTQVGAVGATALPLGNGKQTCFNIQFSHQVKSLLQC